MTRQRSRVEVTYGMFVEGYGWGSSGGRKLHLVALEPWNTTAVCGTGTSGSREFATGYCCPDCARLLNVTVDAGYEVDGDTNRWALVNGLPALPRERETIPTSPHRPHYGMPDTDAVPDEPEVDLPADPVAEPAAPELNNLHAIEEALGRLAPVLADLGFHPGQLAAGQRGTISQTPDGRRFTAGRGHGVLLPAELLEQLVAGYAAGVVPA